MRTCILVLIILANAAFSSGQSTHKKLKQLNINYAYSYVSDGVDSAKTRRTPQEEWYKYGGGYQNLLSTYVKQIEGDLEYVKQHKSYNDQYRYSLIRNSMNYLINYCQQNSIFMDVSDYESELNFYTYYEKRQSEREQVELNARWEKRQKELDSLKIINDSLDKITAREQHIKDSIAQIEREKELKEEKAEKEIQRKKELEKQKKEQAVNAENQKKKHETLIEKYGEQYGELIFKHKVAIGMTKEMCIQAWGKPESINKTTTAYSLHEQWVYNLKSYLYFEDGILTTIQN